MDAFNLVFYLFFVAVLRIFSTDTSAIQVKVGEQWVPGCWQGEHPSARSWLFVKYRWPEDGLESARGVWGAAATTNAEIESLFG